MLRATMVDVRAGIVEPGVAQALASLAKTSVALSHDLELVARIEALERATGATPDNVTALDRKIS